MTHGASQPTLGAHDVSTADGIESLHLIEAAALLALWRSTSERAPISPCTSLSFGLAEWLQRRRVIEIDAQRDQAVAVRAIYDPISWTFVWPEASDPAFGDILWVRVRSLAEVPDASAYKVVMWRMLASAELEGYLGSLLRRHQLDSSWAVDVRDEDRMDQGRISLAQMRYVVWASVREGAAAFMRSGGDPGEAREAIARELRRRAQWVESRPDWGAGYVPHHGGMQSILLRIFLDDIAPMGERYWTSPPIAANLAKNNP